MWLKNRENWDLQQSVNMYESMNIKNTRIRSGDAFLPVSETSIAFSTTPN